VPDSGVRDALVARQPDVYDVDLVEREMRCIAVVGAGASAPLLARSRELADELETKFGRDEAELERLQLVNNLSTEEFETRLVALGKSEAIERQIRHEISEKYKIRHPSLLGYELLAHLLKHRFLDAIISFNFDELLDQSLDDELAKHEYTLVVSERDCDELVSEPCHPAYVPLYVKLHGTASEPESLRFTPHSYYAIPERISGVVQALLRSEHCVIANVGSNLGSFDFQRLLSIPDRLEVYNLSYDPIPARVCAKIARELGRPHGGQHARAGRTRGRPRPVGEWLRECGGTRQSSDQLVLRVVETIGERTGSDEGAAHTSGTLDHLVDFRSVQRHQALAQLLGRQPLAPAWTINDQIVYCRRRTILELALAGAKARGLMSLAPLAYDRPARYYDRYRALTNGGGDDWPVLCSAAGLVESDEIPDILLSEPSLRKQEQPSDVLTEWRLHEFEPRLLATHVLQRVKNNPIEADDVEMLRATIAQLQGEADVELHMRDDRVCSKAFKRPVTLPTMTSMRAYTWLMLQDLDPDDQIHISSETGDWLLKPPMVEILTQQNHIRLLLAFDIAHDRLAQEYDRRRLKTVVVDPWRHSRHMTIVCKRDRPIRAIYFARRLRAPVITAVYLQSMTDVHRLKRLYDLRWTEAMLEARERARRRREEQRRRRRSGGHRAAGADVALRAAGRAKRPPAAAISGDGGN